jgi:hypothetical protein
MWERNISQMFMWERDISQMCMWERNISQMFMWERNISQMFMWERNISQMCGIIEKVYKPTNVKRFDWLNKKFWGTKLVWNYKYGTSLLLIRIK